MQPPPQAVPSGVVRPPPSGSPQTMFWSNSPYRRQAGSHTPMAPITCPLQPVTDPFAFSRQALQSTSLGGSSKSSPPILQGPPSPSSLQRAGLPVPHTNTGDSSQGPCEPLPGPPVQPRADASPFPGAPMPSASHGPETNRSAKAPGPEPELPNPPYPPQYIPAVGSSGSRGGLPQGHVPRPDRPLSRPSPPDSAAPPAALPLPPQPCQQVPGQWGPGQGGPRPPGQQYWPGPEGPPQIPGPHASSVTHFPPLSSLHQHPGHEQLGPPASLPGPSASDGRNEAVCLPSGDHSANSFDPESAFRQNSRVGNARANQELRSSPGVNREQLSGLAAVSPLAQGNGLESHSHCSPGAGGAWTPLEAGSGALAMFFKGGETENEENLSLETAGSAGQADVDGFCLGQLPTRVGAGGAHQAFPRGSSGEPTQLGGEPQPYFPQSAGSPHEKAASKVATVDVWADTARAGAQYENVENLEFVQNQEVLPSEPLSMDPSSPGDLLRCGPLPGPAGPRLGAVGPVGGGGLNLEALDMTARPARSDSVSSGYSGKSHRGLPGARLRDSGTFIQQEVGKPEDESPGRFFKQIDSSPVGGETDETSSQNYLGSLSQPSTPSPPKPTGVFQTSANSSFEPVKSHLVGVKPVEADRANVVGEVRGPSARQQHRAAAATPDAAPGNLEQPPDNMETLFPPQRCVPPLATPLEAGRGLLQATGPPLETVLPTPEKRPSTRVQGPVKCESPATTLWAQNELPDFGGNVLLAPAAPALHVPVKPQPSEVIQPPDAGAARQVGSGGQSGDGLGASENLENPPQLGEEEALPPQAGPSYASLLSSPPAESLQNQPILIAQPDQSYRLAQPVNVSQSLPNPDEKAPSWRDSSAGDKPIVSGRAAGGDPGENVPLSGMPASSLICSPLPNHLAQSPFPQVSGTYDMVSNQAANLLVQPHSHPNTLLPEGQKVHNAESVPPEEVPSPAGCAGLVLVPPASSTSLPDNSKPGLCGRRDGASGALDFMFGRTLENPAGVYSLAHVDGPASVQQPAASRRPPGPGANTSDRFYQQVMKEAHDQPGAERAQQELALPLPAPQGPRAVLPEPSNPGSPPVQAQPADPARPASPAPADAGQQLLPRPPRSSSASVVSTSSGQAAPRPDQQWLQPPPPDLASYFYYRPLYDGYQPPYPYSAYLPDPGPAPHYYQDIYGLYDPRYRPCDSAAYMDPCRYPEPERPSSRASHCSDRPAARQAYPEGYYNSKSGWSSQSDYYAGCYSSQYDYRDPGRWDRLYYSSRFRDPRSYDRRYWHDAEYDSCRKEGYACGDRPEKYDDRYRYDPRFTGSFDDEPEPPRDPYGEEADRRSEHSEHSARSLRSAPSLQSRRSSFSAHSQQSQVYRSHNVPSGSYEVPPPPGSFHGDYAYGPYGSDFHGAPGFPEYGYPAEASWPSVEQAPSRPSSPEKFSVPHVCARFGPGGQLIKVIPNLPSEGQPALVEIHSMETLLQHTPEQEEMRAFPGPLGKDDTHKVDVINFAQNKATKCLQNENLIDKESASLLWSFIVLLCRQNGTVVGTDIAELLLRDHRTVWLPGKSPNEANLIDFTNEAMEQVEEEESGEAQLSFLTDSQAASTLEKDTERFRELLLYGRKKDALESAMKSGLWGHALLLASKMDSRTHARVMTRFANSLPINDPLQTVYQLMSGRMPAASTCCGDEKWGDWRPHLAMILSNLSSNVDVESRAVAAMGDTLASKGLLDAAHFCYLMAQVGFGVYTKKTTKLVLIGSNHSLPFSKFATNEAIQRTEAYEYAQSLGAQACSPPSFQVFKFIYCCRLAEMGLAAQAFHYCEAIAKSVLAQPHRHSPVLLRQLVQVASQLRFFDPQLKEKPEEEASAEPAWLVQLQLVERRVEEGAVAWSQDGACPQRCPSSPSPEVGPRDGPGPTQPAGLGADNPLLAPPAPSTKLFSQDVRQLPSAPSALPAGPAAIPTQVPMFPVPLPAPVELEPVHGPPGAVPGFQEPSGPDPVALYPGPGVPPLQETDCLLPEARSQDAGAVPQETPGRSSLSEPGEEEFGGNFANTGSFRTSPGSEAPPQALQPPAPLTPAPEVQRPVPATKKESKEPKKSSESWFSRWLPVKKRTEAYLPDDKNKSIVWDEKKNRWVDVNEPEEEKKAPPPPPTALPKAPQAAHPVPGGPPRPTVNIYSRKAAGTRARYVDVLNPGGPQRSEPTLAPTDLFAPLAPLPIPAHLLGPNADAEEVPSAEAASREGPARSEPASDPKVFGPAVALLPGPELPASGLDGPQGGELSRCSSLSSLSREVSQHFNQAPGALTPAGAPPGAGVPFYNPAQFAQAPAASGSSRTGRIGQRKYPALS